MKKLLAVALLALSSLASAATLTPIQLLNPASSTSGQAIISTGASTVPAWGNVTATSLAAQAANTVLANVTASSHSPTAAAIPSCSTSTSALQYTSGTGFSCYANSASLTGATFTGASGVGYSNPQFSINDTSGSNKAAVQLQKNGASVWNVGNSSTAGTFAIDRFVSGSYVDSPLTIVNATGAVTFTDGITNSPISGSTGSFTTLAASGTVSGTGFSTYLASPPCVGCTTPGAGKFTTLQATSAITPSTTAGIVGTTLADSANAGSVGQLLTNSTTGTSVTTNTPTNCTSVPLTAGDWDVSGVVSLVPAASTTWGNAFAGVNTASATLGGFGSYVGLQAPFGTGTSQYIATPVVQINVSTTTTAYLIGQAVFGTSTMTCGGVIRARRVR